MKISTYLSLLLAILLSTTSYSQKSFFPKSSIEKVVVYEKGAMITRSIDVSQINEAGTIIIDSLPKGISSKSLQVNSGDGYKIISVKYEIESMDKDIPPAYDETINTLSQLQDSIQYYNTLQSSIRHEIDVIIDNDDFETEQGVDIDQINKASQLYKSRLRALKLEEFDLNLKIRDLQSKIRQVKDELQNMLVVPYQNHKAIIKIDKPKANDRSMTISYFTPRATWYTFYDLRISEDTDNTLDHKAYVSQNTGEDWNNVKLTLSNRNPNKRISPPTITPYKLQNKKHAAYNQNTHINSRDLNAQGVIRGFVTDDSGNPLIGVNISLKGTTHGTITDIDGSFSLSTLQQSIIIVSYVGYETQAVDIRGLSSVNISLSEGQLLDEVVVTGYSTGQSGSSIYKSKKVKKEVRKSISIKEQQSLNVNSFDIERLYTIPSDSEEYDVLLKTSSIPFEFKYLIYPSIEPIAYLNVGIPDWKDYNLFSGNVNLFLGGQYTGVSNIDISEKKDTLWFSLGEDIGINVERAPVKEYNKRSFFKNKTTELHTFDIEIKNNKNKSVSATIIDQVPISKDDDIEVKILEISNAEHNEDQGYLTWKDKLESGDKRKYRISYEIKYGKNVRIVNR